MRRMGPRPLGLALDRLTREATPATALAAVQQCWSTVAGPVVGAQAWPVAERGGIVTVSCRSAVWAQELQLLSEDLLARLNEALAEGATGGALVRLRFDARGLVAK